MTSSATGIADEHRRRAGEQVHAARLGQALLTEHDQASDGGADQRDVEHPPAGRGDPAAGGRRVPALALLASRRVRCAHTASSGGPASAAATISAASHQASSDAGPGVTATATPIPIAAAGSAAAAPPARAIRATWRSDAPRARIMANSVRRCSVTSRAPSSTTTAAITARLTNSSARVRCTASSVATNGLRMMPSPLLSPNVTVAD